MKSFLVLMLVVASASSAQAQFRKQSPDAYEKIAVTEFMNQPLGHTDGRQWVELFNFGDQPVNLKGFQLYDDGRKTCEIPEVTIQPKDFVIVVLGHTHQRLAEDRKKLFEAEWLGGKSDPRVVAIDIGRYRMEPADTLILKNQSKSPIWIMGYANDGTPGRSTYLAIDDFRIRIYGTKDKPAINRNGPDGTVLGYESQSAKQEADASTSDVAGLEAIGGYLYQTKSAGGDCASGIASPLKGNYAGAKK